MAFTWTFDPNFLLSAGAAAGAAVVAVWRYTKSIEKRLTENSTKFEGSISSLKSHQDVLHGQNLSRMQAFSDSVEQREKLMDERFSAHSTQMAQIHATATSAIPRTEFAEVIRRLDERTVQISETLRDVRRDIREELRFYQGQTGQQNQDRDRDRDRDRYRDLPPSSSKNS